MAKIEQRDPYDGLRPWSAITHGVGIPLTLFGGALLYARVLPMKSIPKLVCFTVYLFSMLFLYLSSTLYHCINTSVPGRLLLRKIDHCSIYVFIAGSYTPILMLQFHSLYSRVLLLLAWLIALAGIILTIAKLNIPRWLTSTIYIAMGWLAIFIIVPLFRSMSAYGLTLLVAGGLFYTVGGVLYALKWPGRDNPKFGCHEVFHLFILAGSILHFMLMYQVIAYL